LDLNEVEDIVRDAVRRAGPLSTESRRNGRYVDITIRLSPPDGSDAGTRRARISTEGVEVFRLILPDGFGYHEFDYDYERGGQVAALRLVAALAGEYLHGHFQEKEERRAFGRRQRYLEIAVDGESYRLWQPVSRGSARGERRWFGLLR
jgi:hypothetical protein